MAAASRHPGISSAAKAFPSDQEIARIAEMGVNIKCNCEVAVAIACATQNEYRAVLMTVGMSCGSRFLPLLSKPIT